MATQLSIINTALLLAGTNQITALDDETREARVAAATYTVTREDMLSRYPWDHATGQATLARLVATPLFGYSYAYQLPTDPKAIAILKKDNVPNNYKIYEDKLYSDNTTVNIDYVYDPGEANDPPYFTRLLEFALTEIYAFTLIQDESLGDSFEARKSKQLIVAKNIDAQNSPADQISENEFALTAIR